MVAINDPVGVALLSPPAVPLIGDVITHTVAPLISEAVTPALIKKIFAPQAGSPRFAQDLPFADFASVKDPGGRAGVLLDIMEPHAAGGDTPTARRIRALRHVDTSPIMISQLGDGIYDVTCITVGISHLSGGACASCRVPSTSLCHGGSGPRRLTPRPGGA
jgi:hypothetical protein